MEPSNGDRDIASRLASATSRVDALHLERTQLLSDVRRRIINTHDQQRSGRAARDPKLLNTILKDVGAEVDAAFKLTSSKQGLNSGVVESTEVASAGSNSSGQVAAGGRGRSFSDLMSRADRALGTATEGGERYSCLRTCIERTYVVWGRSVLWLVCMVTGGRAPVSGPAGSQQPQPQLRQAGPGQPSELRDASVAAAASSIGSSGVAKEAGI